MSSGDVDKYLGGVVRRWILVVVVFALLSPVLWALGGSSPGSSLLIVALVFGVLAWLVLRLR